MIPYPKSAWWLNITYLCINAKILYWRLHLICILMIYFCKLYDFAKYYRIITRLWHHFSKILCDFTKSLSNLTESNHFKIFVKLNWFFQNTTKQFHTFCNWLQNIWLFLQSIIRTMQFFSVSDLNFCFQMQKCCKKPCENKSKQSVCFGKQKDIKNFIRKQKLFEKVSFET